jgi:hypothetical protein
MCVGIIRAQVNVEYEDVVVHSKGALLPPLARPSDLAPQIRCIHRFLIAILGHSVFLLIFAGWSHPLPQVKFGSGSGGFWSGCTGSTVSSQTFGSLLAATW